MYIVALVSSELLIYTRFTNALIVNAVLFYLLSTAVLAIMVNKGVSGMAEYQYSWTDRYSIRHTLFYIVSSNVTPCNFNGEIFG